MRKLIKAFYILILILNATLCFAGADEEEDRLNSVVLAPILKNYTISSSIEGLRHLYIKKAQIAKGRQFSADELDEFLKVLAKKPPFNDYKLKCAYEDMRGKWRRDLEHGDSDHENSSDDEYPASAAEIFSENLRMSWNNKMANCGEYAYLVVIILEFNRMNIIRSKMHRFFEKVVLVHSVRGTGDHVFVLVKGVSGIIFAVDPWLRKVKRLEGLNDIPSTLIKDEEIFLNKQENLMLNEQLFKDPYYDIFYVNKETQWFFDIQTSAAIENYAHTKANGMKELYNILLNYEYEFGWTKSYNKLFHFSSKQSDHNNKYKLEHKVS